MSRRIPGGLVAVALIVALVLVAVVGYRARLPTGLRVDSAGPATRTGSAIPTTTNAPCLALPAAIRADSPTLAFVAHGRLARLSLRSCVETTLLATGASGPVRVSADGRWIGSGAAVVTPASGGEVQRPLGVHPFVDPTLSTWAWSPRGDQLAGVTTEGGVVSGAPGQEPTTLEPAGFGASQIIYDGPGAVIVVRDQHELWEIPLGGGRARQVFRDRSAQASLTLATVQDGSAVVWRQAYVSASTAADGDPLWRIDLATGAAHVIAHGVLLSPGFVEPCGRGLVIAAGGGRAATAGKAITVVSPSWRQTVVGTGVSPSCAADGRTVAYAAGHHETGYAFGDERRRIWIARLRSSGTVEWVRPVDTVLTRGPGANEPILSADGRIVLWAQSQSEQLDAADGPTANGALRVAEVTTPSQRTGPLADLGTATDYYGTWTWQQTIAVVPPPR